MIDFEYWVDNIVGTCELIESEDALRKVWIEGDHSITSIHYFDELYEQVLGDNHTEELIPVFAPRIADDNAIEALSQYVAALHAVDAQIEGNPVLKDPAILLASSEWNTFRQSAKRVVELPCFQEYRNGRKEREILNRLNAERRESDAARG